MEPKEEREMLLEKLQWARMRMNEANAEWQLRYYELQTSMQAMIHHLEAEGN